MNSSLETIRTNSSHSAFVDLVKQLDKYLEVLDGDEHDFYNQFNNIDVLKNVVIAFDGKTVVGCGAFKEYTSDTIEIKRMFTLPIYRGNGIAKTILNELESWAKEDGYSNSLLETGIKMPDAIGLYQKLGYHQVANYGQYVGKELSVCFGKCLG